MSWTTHGAAKKPRPFKTSAKADFFRDHIQLFSTVTV